MSKYIKEIKSSEQNLRQILQNTQKIKLAKLWMEISKIMEILRSTYFETLR